MGKRIITRLLPQSSMFQRVANNLGKFFTAIDEELDELVEEAKSVYLDVVPEDTENLEAWADQFALPEPTVPALQAVWQEKRDMSPQHIEDRLTAAGYTVKVYDWWVPGSDPKVPRLLSEAGYFLVDGKLESHIKNSMRSGDSIARAGDTRALAGYQIGGAQTRVVYEAPLNDRAVIYIEYTDTGDRRGFEDLVLKVVPAHLWIGIIEPAAPGTPLVDSPLNDTGSSTSVANNGYYNNAITGATAGEICGDGYMKLVSPTTTASLVYSGHTDRYGKIEFELNIGTVTPDPGSELEIIAIDATESYMALVLIDAGLTIIYDDGENYPQLLTPVPKVAGWQSVVIDMEMKRFIYAGVSHTIATYPDDSYGTPIHMEMATLRSVVTTYVDNVWLRNLKISEWEAAPEYFNVINTYPVDNEEWVPIMVQYIITFDEAMDMSTASDGLRLIKISTGEEIPLDNIEAYSATEVSFFPMWDLEDGTEYEIMWSSLLRSATGKLLTPGTSMFTTDFPV